MVNIGYSVTYCGPLGTDTAETYRAGLGVVGTLLEHGNSRVGVALERLKRKCVQLQAKVPNITPKLQVTPKSESRTAILKRVL